MAPAAKIRKVEPAGRRRSTAVSTAPPPATSPHTATTSQGSACARDSPSPSAMHTSSISAAWHWWRRRSRGASWRP
ncbi:hypothetical protein AB0O80_08625 [Rothia kristinae]|nr:hypothetical protein [Rothia kristinae]